MGRPHTTAPPVSALSRGFPARLFKRDRPRAIDRYIDYFGSATGQAARAGDPCGEALLDCLDAATHEIEVEAIASNP